MNRRQGRISRGDWLTLLLSVCLAALMGFIWVVLVAAWEHHDEHQHFQVVRRVADGGEIEQQDFHLNRQILTSMVWNGFFTRLGPEPLLPPPGQAVYLPGYSQVGEPSLYYCLAAIPVHLLREANITRQMYAARLVSWVFFLLTVVAAWGIARELAPERHPLRWMVPLWTALLPGLVDVMTAVNNDAAAVAVVSGFLWAGTRLVRRGFSWGSFVLATALAGLGVVTKSSATLALAILPLVMLLAITRSRGRWIPWALLIVGGMAAWVLLVKWDDARAFYRSSEQADGMRVRSELAVDGEWVLRVDESAGVTPPWMPPAFSALPLKATGQHLGESFILGVWMWAEREIGAQTPKVVTEHAAYAEAVQLSTQPVFYTIQGKFDAESARVWIDFDPIQGSEAGAKVYYDGLVLASGERPGAEVPIFQDPGWTQGEWGGQPFTNLLTNGSFESPGPRLRGTVDRLGSRFLPDSILPSFIVASVFDPQGSGWYYRLAAERIWRSFWGWFGWTHIPLPEWVYGVCAASALLALAGLILGMFFRRTALDMHLVLFFAGGWLAAFLAALARGVIYLDSQNMFFPVARYVAPFILPAMVALSTGWLEVGRVLRNGLRRILPKITWWESPWLGRAIWVILWLSFAIVAIASVVSYYGGWVILR